MVTKGITALRQLELAHITFVDGEYKESEAIVVYDPTISSLEDNHPDVRPKVRILSYKVGDIWKNSDGVSSWFANNIQSILKKSSDPTDEVATI